MIPLPELLERVRQAPHRGYTHVFLGDPLSDGGDKTTVEPGNIFSPGVWTCGISVWVETAAGVFTPDLMPAEAIAWNWEQREAFAPVLLAAYDCGPALRLENRLVHQGGPGSEGADFCRVSLEAGARVEGRIFIAVRDTGPAGGKLAHLRWDEAAGILELDGGSRLTPETTPDYVHVEAANDAYDSPAGVLGFDFSIEAGARWKLDFKVEHALAHRAFGSSVPLRRPYAQVSTEDALKCAQARWKRALPSRIFAPDERIEAAWNGCAYHLLAAMESAMPRIGAVNYPVFWIRDGVLVLRALDLMGRADLARAGCDYLGGLDFGGGFGAESDAPGQGIWELCEHARLTGDRAWLQTHFADITRRVRWIQRMLNATEPLYHLAENRLPNFHHAPGINLLCLPAENGLIHGRMDWHSPDFYINCWALCGLREAAWAARLLGKEPEAMEWMQAARTVEIALQEHGLPGYGNPRDPAVTPHPTGVLAGSGTRPELIKRFRDWYHQHRLGEDGNRKPEVLWTYFEAAQAHNALLLGLRDEFWVTMNGLLDDGARHLWAYIEGRPSGSEYLPYQNGHGRRGWLHPEAGRGGNMPHNWTSAEMLLALRSIFVTEGQNELILGSGVPAAWLRPGAKFGVENLTTEFGPLSYAAHVGADGRVELDYSASVPSRVQWDS